MPNMQSPDSVPQAMSTPNAEDTDKNQTAGRRALAGTPLTLIPRSFEQMTHVSPIKRRQHEPVVRGSSPNSPKTSISTKLKTLFENRERTIQRPMEATRRVSRHFKNLSPNPLTQNMEDPQNLQKTSPGGPSQSPARAPASPSPTQGSGPAEAVGGARPKDPILKAPGAQPNKARKVRFETPDQSTPKRKIARHPTLPTRVSTRSTKGRKPVRFSPSK